MTGARSGCPVLGKQEQQGLQAELPQSMPHLGCCGMVFQGVNSLPNPLSLAPLALSLCPDSRTYYHSLCTHRVFSTLPRSVLERNILLPLLDRCMAEAWKSRCPAQSHTAGEWQSLDCNQAGSWLLAFKLCYLISHGIGVRVP